MPTISNVRLVVLPGTSSSEARVTYTINFETAAYRKQFRETVMLMSHDKPTFGYIPKIIGNIVSNETMAASELSMERTHSRFFSNADLNEDPSYLDDYYAIALLESIAEGGSARSNTIKRKF